MKPLGIIGDFLVFLAKSVVVAITVAMIFLTGYSAGSNPKVPQFVPAGGPPTLPARDATYRPGPIGQPVMPDSTTKPAHHERIRFFITQDANGNLWTRVPSKKLFLHGQEQIEETATTGPIGDPATGPIGEPSATIPPAIEGKPGLVRPPPGR